MLAVVEMHKVPVVDVQLLLDAGAARDPSSVPGLATFTATMLQQGAGARSALDVADEAAFLGAQLGTTASFDGASASIHVPKRRLEAGLDLRSEEHTSELQSLAYLVCRLLLEKKKKQNLRLDRTQQPPHHGTAHTRIINT